MANPRQPPRSEDLTDPTSVWMIEVTGNLERLSGRVEANESAIGRLATEVRSSVEVARAAAQALERIAKVEEAREKREGLIHRERSQWFERLWESTAVQLLLVGIVLAIFQVLGVAYLADRLLPPVQLPRTESTLRGGGSPIDATP